MRSKILMKYLIVVVLFFVSASVFAFRPDTSITYVNLSAKGANNGTSWADAYVDLQTALNDPQATQIWVSQGVYTPTALCAENCFIIDGFGAAGFVYGGFSGVETSLEQRNIKAHVSQLGIYTKNGCVVDSNKVVINSSSKSNDLVFDGFTIKATPSCESAIFSDLLLNVQIVDCLIGQKLLNNSDQFLVKDSFSDRFKSLTVNNDDSFTNSGDSQSLQHNFSVYPTTCSSTINVETSTPALVEFIDYLGRIAKRVKVAESPMEIDVSNLLKGLYIVKISNKQSGISTTRIVVQ